MTARTAFCLLPLLAMAFVAQADIYFDDAADCIRVVDYPQDAPCTLQRLLAMDRLYGWDTVAYDASTDTYTVRANLAIGINTGVDTFFQFGSPEHPSETLIMEGNLLVYPYWINGLNPEESISTAPKGTNRLTIGVPGDDAVTPTLKFNDPEKLGHSLYVCMIPSLDGKRVDGRGGELHVHNATITSATPEPGGEFGAPAGSGVGGMVFGGDSIVLDGAIISWVAGAATYGMSDKGSVSNTVFEHLGTAIINGRQNLTGCAFRDCEVAVKDYGSLDAVLTDCVFDGNGANWTLTYTNKGLVCIDCTWDVPTTGDQYRAWKSKRTGQMQYPSFVSKRHIVVEVVDEAQKPISGAEVHVRCEQQTSEIGVLNATQQTDDAGRTPGKGGERPILLTEIVKQASDTPNQPTVTEFSYAVEAAGDGYAAATIAGYVPGTSWDVVRLKLKKQ